MAARVPMLPLQVRRAVTPNSVYIQYVAPIQILLLSSVGPPAVNRTMAGPKDDEDTILLSVSWNITNAAFINSFMTRVGL